MIKPGLAGKLKDLAREKKEEASSGVKKLGDKRNSNSQVKRNSNDSKESGRKN